MPQNKPNPILHTLETAKLITKISLKLMEITERSEISNILKTCDDSKCTEVENAELASDKVFYDAALEALAKMVTEDAAFYEEHGLQVEQITEAMEKKVRVAGGKQEQDPGFAKITNGAYSFLFKPATAAETSEPAAELKAGTGYKA